MKATIIASIYAFVGYAITDSMVGLIAGIIVWYLIHHRDKTNPKAS
jgi:hypothetical protein